MSFKYSAVAAVNIDNSYVLDIAAAPSVALLAAACSSGAVKVFHLDPAGGLTAHGGGGAGGAGKNAPATSASPAPATSSLSPSFAHTKPATSLAWHSGSASLLSASKDGTVACWDVRLGDVGKAGSGGPPALRLQAREPLHSVCFVEESRSVSSPPPSAPATSAPALVAAGGDGRIFLWDARTGKELSVFEDTHEGDVSVLVRAPVRPTIRADDGSLRTGGGGSGSGACFLSAGVDGLVALWDVSLSSGSAAAGPSPPSPHAGDNDDDDEAKTPEDEAFVTALNTNTSVSRMGLCCPHGGGGGGGAPSSSLESSGSLHLWATTGVEGMLTWDWGAACDEADAAGGLGPSSLVADARGELLQQRRKNKGNAAAAAAATKGPSSYDYVVGCVAVAGAAASASSTLLLAAGDHSGRLALFPLGPPATRGGAPTLLGPPSPMAVPAGSSSLTGKPFRGHSATVRALAAAAPGGRALATGGEDGLVVVWAPSGGGGGGGGSGGGGGCGGGGGGDDEDDAAQRDFSRLGVSAAADGVAKKKKKRRHKQTKKSKGGREGDGGGASTAVEMAVE